MHADPFLALLAPWPKRRPDLPEHWHGWFGHWHENLLGRQLGAATKLVIELGSWWPVDQVPAQGGAPGPG